MIDTSRYAAQLNPTIQLTVRISRSTEKFLKPESSVQETRERYQSYRSSGKQRNTELGLDNGLMVNKRVAWEDYSKYGFPAKTKVPLCLNNNCPNYTCNIWKDLGQRGGTNILSSNPCPFSNLGI